MRSFFGPYATYLPERYKISLARVMVTNNNRRISSIPFELRLWNPFFSESNSEIEAKTTDHSKPLEE